MSEPRYGAKCIRCTHVDHRDYPVEEQSWLGPLKCPTCDFCQWDALSDLIVNHGGIELFDPEVRAAVKAFKEGKPHPLIDQLRVECEAIERDVVYEEVMLDAESMEAGDR